MGVSCLLPRHSKAITTSQFLDHFRRAWTDDRLPRRLGLAVSGGADSMALAYLCNQLEKSNLVDGLSVTAFIVDHKAREESSREAAVVESWLSQMGVKTKILELKWPNSEKTKPTAFETVARRLRFQALGTACRDLNVETLLMGHHQDDNIETTIWRLCINARGSGLAGIPTIANIPECHGLYGVSGSGSCFTLSSSSSNSGSVTTNGETVNLDTDPERRSTKIGYRVSTGSITVCRPLLGLPKKYLLETCHGHSIPFVDDPTNFDPTLTARNAIRALRSENRLPRALGTESILSLIGKSRALLDTSARLAEEVLMSCTVLRLDLSAGWMVIRFPPEQEDADAEPSRRRNQILTIALRRITELISPFPDAHFPLRSFEDFTGRVFPAQPWSNSGIISDSRQSFTLGGVMFQPLRHKPSPTIPCKSEPTGKLPDDEKTTWLLTRQPFMRNRLPSLDVNVPVSLIEDQKYTQWSLWDNRYWIRIGIQNHQNQNTADTSYIPIKMRPLQRKDIQRLRVYFPKSTNEHPVWTNLSERLKSDAPGLARFSLPVLTVTGDAVGIDQDEVLLALPTLGVKVPLSLLGSSWDIYWEWMYKEIDRATVTSMGFSIKDNDNS